MTKKIAVLFGMEDTFPWALMNAINDRAKGEIEGVPLQTSYLKDTQDFEYDVILDRISHEVPFYRTLLKCAIARGVTVINNPFWWAADDKFFNNVVAEACGVAVPKTILLPHKEHPPNTQAKSFRNMKFVEWNEVFEYLGFPIFMKPANGGGWRDVYKCDNEQEFFAAYDQSRDLSMMAQEAIDFTDYYRCYGIGRTQVHVMKYDPRQPHHLRYVRDAEPDPKMLDRVKKDAIALCQALGYELNTIEFAVRDGIPYAIDFMNPAPDADVNSVGEDNFAWVVNTMADLLIDKVRNPQPFEPMGTWPKLLGVDKPGKRSSSSTVASPALAAALRPTV